MTESSGFLAMGGYAAFVWPAYAIAVLVIGGLIVQSAAALRARTREAAEAEAANPRRARRRRGEGASAEVESDP